MRNPRQLRRSLYLLFFQLPLLPERVLTRDAATLVARTLRGGSHVREAWPREELDLYRAAFLEPGAARAALAYYRTAARRPLMRAASGAVAPDRVRRRSCSGACTTAPSARS